MASNVKSTTSNQQATRVQRYVDDQLEKTRGQVKTNELMVACLTWAVAVAIFFLTMAVIDAWILSLSTTWRWIALTALGLGSIAWVALVIVPLFLRKINLNYAAQMIEQASPDVKNRVLNYSLLRKADRPMNVAVMDAVSRQAAEKLNSIPSDSTIDRSKLIRIGFMLVGVMVFAVAYKLLSPRDPLQTVQRILFPSELIAKPASVQISAVNPGNARVFFGDSLPVTARITGPHEPEDVQLIISSDDGQITDLAVPMTLDESGREYAALISPGETGIQQTLRYRIEARDGVSPDYQVSVKANPSIAIEQIQLTPPPYTGLPQRTLNGRGDIEAIEGTEAMIFAVANLPIQVAYIELLNEIETDGSDTPNATVMKPASPPIEMRLLPDNRASGRFNLTLNASRTRPRATHYQIRFVSQDDERNETPNVYPIRVIPDLAPEIRITAPQSQQTNIAANGRLPIRVEANDLDFAIDSVVLNMDHQGGQLIRQTMKLESDNDNQRVTCRFLFEPARYRLQPGDQVMFHAVALDNRVSTKSLAHDPNVSQTENFTITITEANADADQTEQSTDPEQQREQQPDQNNDSGDENGAQDQGTDGASGEATEQSDSQGSSETGDEGTQPDGNDSAEDATGSGEQGNTSDAQDPQDGNTPEQGEGGSGQPQDTGSAEQNSSDNQQQSEATGRNESRNEGTSDQGASEGSPDGRGGSEAGADGSESGGNEVSDTGSGGTPDGSDAQGPAGTDQNNPNAQASDSSNDSGATGSQSEGGARGNPDDSDSGQQGTRDESLQDGNRERLPKDAHDGEKFEKLDELLNDQESSEGPSDPANNRQESGQPPSQNSDQNNEPNPSGSQGNPDASDTQGSQGNESGEPNNQPPQNNGQPNENSQGGQGSESSEGTNNSSKPEGSSGEPQPSEGSGESGQPSGESGQPSGESGQPSDGSGTPSNSGSEQGGQETGDSSQDGSEQSSSDSQPQSQSGSNSDGSETGQPGEASNSGQPSDADGNAQNTQGESVENAATSGQQGSGAGTDQAGDQQLEKERADLDHAKKATDLILNRLEDQRENPDPDLLDKMNWTEQDLREFLDRWKQMKQNAGAGDQTARNQYEEAIKSLGLRPDGSSRTSKNRDANTSGLNQDSSVIEPPVDLAPEFNDFLRDRNRVR